MIFLLIVSAGTVWSQAEPEEGGHEVQVWAGGGHSVPGGTQNTEAFNAGLRYGWVITGPHLARIFARTFRVHGGCGAGLPDLSARKYGVRGGIRPAGSEVEFRAARKVLAIFSAERRSAVQLSRHSDFHQHRKLQSQRRFGDAYSR